MFTSALVFLITLALSEGERYIGCYRDTSLYVRLLADHYEDFPGALTPDLCIGHCRQNGMSYAGLEYGHECFCSKERPPFTSLVSHDDCKMKCEGDLSKICGGGLKLSVYDIEVVGANHQISNYIGCFADSRDERTLPYMMWEFPSLLTPEYCMGQCWNQGFRYAGVQYGKECHCRESFRESNRVPESECATPCPGDSSIKCGSGFRINFYKTEIPDLSEEEKLLGCYSDESDVRLLSGLELSLTETNTPRKCFNLCYSLGFKYSGVQYREECFCGNRKPPLSLEVSENECHSPCSGDANQYCGANYRLLVYSTGKDGNTNFEEKLSPSRPTLSMSTCKKSETQVNGKSVCQGSVIYQEEFNSALNRLHWSHSILMPWAPDYDFVVFTKKSTNSYVRDGKLFIKPTVQDDDHVRTGKIELADCTGELYTEECERRAIAFSILPPVESARLNIKEFLSFKFGRVDIRAKLPQGDWIVPELWLEPKRRVYGRGYASGRMRIAFARGNINLLTEKSDEIGGRMLETGVIVGQGNSIKGRSIVRMSSQLWSDQFHNYSLTWTPDNILFSVNGRGEQAMLPKGKRQLRDLFGFNSTETWSTSNHPLAPFDQEFYLSLGVSVGGMRTFPDDSVSSGKKKPWRNLSVKGLAAFFRAQEDWYSTWTEDSALQIDSIKITAL